MFAVSGEVLSALIFLEKKKMPAGWNWQTQLGSSEVYDLWRPPELVGANLSVGKVR